MAKWTAEKRAKYPLKYFGDPENREYPIEDQDDVRSAARLLGKAKDPQKVKRRIIAIAKMLGLEIPKAWQKAAPVRMSTQPFDMALFGNDGEMVTYTGKVGEAGSYPDVVPGGFDLTEEDIDDAIAHFEPVLNDMEHLPDKGVKTILDNKLGFISNPVRVDNEIFADVTVPKWLAALVEDKPISISLGWDPVEKRITRSAIVLDPRVEDAQVIAAFSNSGHGNQKPENPQRKGFPMEFIDSLKEAMRQVFSEQKATPSAPPPVEPPVLPAKTAEVIALEAQVAQFSKAQEAVTNRALTLEAEKAYQDLFAKNKVTPAEKEDVIALFSQMAKDDQAGGLALFSADGKFNPGDRVARFMKILEARPENILFSNFEGAKVLGNDDSNADAKPMSEARRKQLLAMTGVKS